MSWYRLPVAAAFPYFTNKTVQTDNDRQLQRFLWAVKDGKSISVDGRGMPAAEWFVQNFQPDSRERPFLNRERTLVPIPSSKATQTPADRSRWVCYDISARMAENGWAKDARPLLLRTTAVRSSREARAAGEQPPTVLEHTASMSIDLAMLDGVVAITLVDDVVSAGRNSMGAVQALRRAGFEGDIRLFSVSYTNYTPGLRDPFYGHVIWQEGNETSFRPSDAEEPPFEQTEPIGPWSPDPPATD